MDKEFLNSEILKEFITDDYLVYNNLLEIKNTFSKNHPKSIKLDKFFKDDKYKTLQKEILNLKFKKDYLPLEHSFSKSNLGSEFKKLLESEEFKTFIQFITGKKIIKQTPNSIFLEHKDYTLLKDDFNESFLEINFFFTDKWEEDFGGYFSYFKDEELLRILPSGNSVTLVNIDLGVQNFIKYINVNSGKNKIYLINLKI